MRIGGVGVSPAATAMSAAQRSEFLINTKKIGLTRIDLSIKLMEEVVAVIFILPNKLHNN